MEFSIEREFIIEFFRELKKTGNAFSNPEKTELILNANKALFNKKVSYKNIPHIRPEELKEYIFKNLDSNEADITKLFVFKDETIDSSMFSYSFISNLKYSKSIREERKQQSYNLSDLLNPTINRELFTSSPYNIKNELKTWESLSEKTLPFHFLIINDAFIFLNKPNALCEMITALLSKALSRNVCIIINTSKDCLYPGHRNNNDNVQVDNIVQSGLEKRKKEMSSKFPEVDFLISENKYHKRLFFTNSQFVHSDNSFSNYFNVDEQIRVEPYLSFDDTHQELCFYRNQTYISKLLHKISASYNFAGSKTSLVKIIEEINKI